MSNGSNSRVPVVLFAISGVLYAARGLMDLGDPMYYDPATLLDYAAAITTTISMVALGAAIASLAITHTVIGRARVVAWVPAAGLAFAGVANLLGDVFDIGRTPDGESGMGLGVVFGGGGAIGLVGLVVLGVSMLLDRRNDRGIGVVLLLMGLAFTLPPFGRLAGIPILCFVMAYVLVRRTERSGEPESRAPSAEEAQS